MCDRYVVGEIQGYDVIYIPEKDIVFCKNTAIKLSVLDKAVKSHTISSTIEEKNLTITKDNGTLCLGCLTTTLDKYRAMKRKISKLRF